MSASLVTSAVDLVDHQTRCVFPDKSQSALLFDLDIIEEVNCKISSQTKTFLFFIKNKGITNEEYI